MKKIIFISFLIFCITLKSQSLHVYDFIKVYKIKTLEEKSDFLYKEKFTKDDSFTQNGSSFIKKRFRGRTQEFDLEIIIISNNQITYSLSEPKAFYNFKNMISKIYQRNEQESNNIEIIYQKDKKSDYKIKITETNITFQDSKRNLFNFICYPAK